MLIIHIFDASIIAGLWIGGQKASKCIQEIEKFLQNYASTNTFPVLMKY